jgi:hypothetical protein
VPPPAHKPSKPHDYTVFYDATHSSKLSPPRSRSKPLQEADETVDDLPDPEDGQDIDQQGASVSLQPAIEGL